MRLIARSSLALLLGVILPLLKADDAEGRWQREDEAEAEKEAIKEMRSPEKIAEEFKQYDIDGNGILDAADIRSKLGKYLDPVMIFEFFSNADSNEDGTITGDEYFNYVTNMNLVKTKTRK